MVCWEAELKVIITVMAKQLGFDSHLNELNYSLANISKYIYVCRNVTRICSVTEQCYCNIVCPSESIDNLVFTL